MSSKLDGMRGGWNIMPLYTIPAIIIITAPKSSKTPLATPLPIDRLSKNTKAMTFFRKYSVLMIFQDLDLLKRSAADEKIGAFLILFQLFLNK